MYKCAIQIIAVPDMTYNVFGGTLNLAQSISLQTIYLHLVVVQERVNREQAELRRRKMELEQAERSKVERERQRAREEEEAVESALKAQQRDTGSHRDPASQHNQQMTESQLMAQKERERQREQQRRRLAAVSQCGEHFLIEQTLLLKLAVVRITNAEIILGLHFCTYWCFLLYLFMLAKALITSSHF